MLNRLSINDRLMHFLHRGGKGVSDDTHANSGRPGQSLMGRCIYCGRPAGLFRKAHEECKAKHDYALPRIPEFFPKFFDSDLPADRFCELLKEGARTAYISDKELGKAVARGLALAIDAILQRNTFSTSTGRHCLAMLEAFRENLSDQPELNEAIAKCETLLRLYEGTIPEIVSVGGDFPIPLSSGEVVLWILNDVAVCSENAKDGAEQIPPGFTIIPGNTAYIPMQALAGHELPSGNLNKTSGGDLVITNVNLFSVGTYGLVVRVPLARLSRLSAYEDGIALSYGTASAPWTRAFSIDDGWFVANLLAQARRLQPASEIIQGEPSSTNV